MSEKGLEVLSPAGNLDIFKAVINAGADAVYFGGDKFGARAFAQNFSIQEAEECIRYAHVHGSKAYLTLNTLLKNTEVERELYDYLRAYYEIGLDAVIVQDMGVFAFVKEFFPDLSLHASTQMTITNAPGAKLLQEMGADRIVTSREISLTELQNIYDATGVEIETFVHGALCVSYSGQCLMSSMIGGRSGNRGRCAQPCRLPYEVLDGNGGHLSLPGAYVLSPKDLCAIAEIPQLSESGVYSLKIEGRMKQLQYAAGVVSVYRKYVDAYMEHGAENYMVSKADMSKLYDLGNRCGFTNRYLYEQNGKDMITFEEPSHKKSQNTDTEYPEQKISVDGILEAHVGEPLQLTVHTNGMNDVRVEGNVVDVAMKQPATIERVEEQLQKTGNTSFAFEHLEIHMDDNVFLPVQRLKELRRNALDIIMNNKLSGANRTDALPFVSHEQEQKAMIRQTREAVNKAGDKHPKLCVTVETMKQFEVALAYDEISKIIIDCDEMFLSTSPIQWAKNAFDMAKKCNKEFLLSFPVIFRQKTQEIMDSFIEELLELPMDGIMVHSYDALGYLQQHHYPKEKILCNHRLYTFSNQAITALEQEGYQYFSAPLELNEKELRHRMNHKSQMVIYNDIPVMITANCMHKNCKSCDKKSEVMYLLDRYDTSFPVKNHCAFCYNIIYNSKKYCLFSNVKELQALGFKEYRIDFTIEDSGEMRQVMDSYRRSFIMGDVNHSMEQQDQTRGHFKRGVE